MYEALSYEYMRPSATGVRGLQLLVSEGLMLLGHSRELPLAWRQRRPPRPLRGTKKAKKEGQKKPPSVPPTLSFSF